MHLRPRGYAVGAPSSGGSGAPDDHVVWNQKAVEFWLRGVFGRRVHPGALSALVCLLFVSLFMYMSTPSDMPQTANVGGVGSRLRGAFGRTSQAEVGLMQDPRLSGGGQPVLRRMEHNIYDYVRGATAELQTRYVEHRKADQFDCFDGSQVFASFDVVNDDFCDCADGSDEPGTAACVGFVTKKSPGFSCGWASGHATVEDSKGRDAVVRLGAVNDGICDCCGGEDEWDFEHGAAVCPDRCAIFDAEEKKEESAREAGSLIRDFYVKKAQTLEVPKIHEKTDFGPDNIFLAVRAEGCLKFEDSDFTYDVCLFDKVTQRENKRSGRRNTIGKKGEWATTLWENGEHRKDYSKLIMGDGEFCHASHAPRRSEVEFECAAKNEIISIRETQVCVYTVHMKTPAACHPRS